MGFNHAHGSINPLSPLLNFDPPWMARKPYTCQTCYSSMHASYECPLPAVRLGGVLVVSHTSHEAMLKKKAAECLIVIDRSLIPKKPAPTPSDAPPDAPLPCPKVTPPTLPTIHEGTDFVDSIASFLAIKLHKHIGPGPDKIPVAIIRHAAECGSLSGAIALLTDYVPTLSSWEFLSVQKEFSGWMNDTLIPGSEPCDEDESMSEVATSSPALVPSVKAPAPATSAPSSCTFTFVP